MTVVFPHPLFSITSPQTFSGRKWLFSRLLLLLPACQAYCLLMFIAVLYFSTIPGRTSTYFCVLFVVKNFHIIFFIVLFHRSTRVEGNIISCQYPLYMLVVELHTLVRPQQSEARSSL